MLIDLQAHYLDLIVQAIEAAGHACLLKKTGEDRGVIYVTQTSTSTKSAAVLCFDFQDTSAVFGVQFRDGREPFTAHVSYHDGLDVFFQELLRVLTGNRIEDRRAA